MKWISSLIIIMSSWSVIADNTDYVTGFKVPVLQTFCMSRSLSGDIVAYKQCMLVVEKESYNCDKESKPAYDALMAKNSKNNRGISEFMEEIKPITKKHFECLSSLL